MATTRCRLPYAETSIQPHVYLGEKQRPSVEECRRIFELGLGCVLNYGVSHRHTRSTPLVPSPYHSVGTMFHLRPVFTLVPRTALSSALPWDYSITRVSVAVLVKL